MGRIQVQTFTEKNTKAVGGKGDSSNAVGNGKLVVNKVTNYMSSVCGSNSSDFDRYIDGRKRERDRLDTIEADAKRQKEEEEFAAKVAENKKECEERTNKNALKRKRKKENQKKNKLVHVLKGDNGDDCEEGGSGGEEANAIVGDDGI